MSHELPSSTGDNDLNPMDLLLAKLSEQQSVINKQHHALRTVDDVAYTRTVEYLANSSGSSAAENPEADTAGKMARNTSPVAPDNTEAEQPSAEEVIRLKLELEKAKGKIAQMDQELTQTRITKHTIEQVIGTASEADFPLNQPGDLKSFPQALNPASGASYGRDNSWIVHEDAHSDTSDALSASGFNRARAIWGNNGRQQYPMGLPDFQAPPTAFPHGAWVGRGFSQQLVEPPSPYGPSLGGFRADRLTPDLDTRMGPPGERRNNRNNSRLGNRNNGAFPYAGSASPYEGYGPGIIGYSSVAGMAGSAAGATGAGLGMGLGLSTAMDYHPQPIGTPLSPFAPEFTSTGEAWKNDVRATK
jgi:hypothetical protein